MKCLARERAGCFELPLCRSLERSTFIPVAVSVSRSHSISGICWGDGERKRP